LATTQLIATLIGWLPTIFNWALAPAACLLLLLAFFRKARTGATWGLVTIAALSLSLLSLGAAAVFYVGWEFWRVALDLLVEFGPRVAINFLARLFRGVGVLPLDLGPMIATAAGSTIAAIALGGPRKVDTGVGDLE